MKLKILLLPCLLHLVIPANCIPRILLHTCLQQLRNFKINHQSSDFGDNFSYQVRKSKQNHEHACTYQGCQRTLIIDFTVTLRWIM